ncbi:MAG: amidohydrolase family protein [Terrimicrobiaceae bacterium]|nr:amidohydrolase family protein [Terrimicrobiaceae bacterium]
MMAKSLKGLRGFLIDAPERGRLRGVRDGAVLIEDGVLVAVGPFDEVRRSPGAEYVKWQHSPEAVLIPGLIDLHAHLPQYPVVARAEESLLPWLQRIALPAEKEFNAAAARAQAPHFYEALARNGTTCAMLHAATYEQSCDVAFEAAERSGMRIILGKVMMDEAGCGGLSPREKLPLSLARSERLCRKWHGCDGGRIEYAFSPRFAVGCSEELLREAALLARKFDAYVQTSLSESCGGTGAVYEACGLLGERTVLAHCVHPDDEEVRLLAVARVAVAHSPTADLFLNSGIMPLDRLLDAGLRVGLASDVAGGPELNLWQVMRSTIESQKARSFYEKEVRVPTAAEVFHLATLGGAGALGKGSLIGTFDVGKDADIVAFDLAQALSCGGRGNMHCDLSPEEVVTLLVYRGGPAAVIETYVRGVSIYRAPAPQLL